MLTRLMTLDALRPFLERRRTRENMRERCEICASHLEPAHPHLLERETRKLLCSCRPCAALFKDTSASNGRLRTVLDRVLVDPVTSVPEEAWATLSIPVGLAFLTFDSTQSTWSAAYPSPAGPVRAEVPHAAWEAFAAMLPLAHHVQPDIEALVVRRGRDGVRESFVAPVDVCYGLVGAIRMRWKGIEGGDEVRDTIEDFFQRLRRRARSIEDSRRGAT
jgi:Family of unknown function (DUF5947)